MANDLVQEITPQDVLTDRELARFLFKDKCRPTSWKTIQKMARDGDIRGQQIGRGSWIFHMDAVKDFLMRPSH